MQEKLLGYVDIKAKFDGKKAAQLSQFVQDHKNLTSLNLSQRRLCGGDCRDVDRDSFYSFMDVCIQHQNLVEVELSGNSIYIDGRVVPIYRTDYISKKVWIPDNSGDLGYRYRSGGHNETVSEEVRVKVRAIITKVEIGLDSSDRVRFEELMSEKRKILEKLKTVSNDEISNNKIDLATIKKIILAWGKISEHLETLNVEALNSSYQKKISQIKQIASRYTALLNGEVESSEDIIELAQLCKANQTLKVPTLVLSNMKSINDKELSELFKRVSKLKLSGLSVNSGLASKLHKAITNAGDDCVLKSVELEKCNVDESVLVGFIEKLKDKISVEAKGKKNPFSVKGKLCRLKIVGSVDVEVVSMICKIPGLDEVKIESNALLPLDDLKALHPLFEKMPKWFGEKYNKAIDDNILDKKAICRKFYRAVRQFKLNINDLNRYAPKLAKGLMERIRQAFVERIKRNEFYALNDNFFQVIGLLQPFDKEALAELLADFLKRRVKNLDENIALEYINRYLNQFQDGLDNNRKFFEGASACREMYSQFINLAGIFLKKNRREPIADIKKKYLIIIDKINYVRKIDSSEETKAMLKEKLRDANQYLYKRLKTWLEGLQAPVTKDLKEAAKCLQLCGNDPLCQKLLPGVYQTYIDVLIKVKREISIPTFDSLEKEFALIKSIEGSNSVRLSYRRLLKKEISKYEASDFFKIWAKKKMSVKLRKRLLEKKVGKISSLYSKFVKQLLRVPKNDLTNEVVLKDCLPSLKSYILINLLDILQQPRSFHTFYMTLDKQLNKFAHKVLTATSLEQVSGAVEDLIGDQNKDLKTLKSHDRFCELKNILEKVFVKDVAALRNKLMSGEEKQTTSSTMKSETVSEGGMEFLVIGGKKQPSSGVVDNTVEADGDFRNASAPPMEDGEGVNDEHVSNSTMMQSDGEHIAGSLNNSIVKDNNKSFNSRVSQKLIQFGVHSSEKQDKDDNDLNLTSLPDNLLTFSNSKSEKEEKQVSEKNSSRRMVPE